MSDEEPLGPDDARVAAELRRLTEADHTLTPPPAGLWDAIAAEVAEIPAGPQAPPTTAEPTPAEAGRDPVDLATARRRRNTPGRWLLGAAAAVAVLAVAAVSLLSGGPGDPDARADLVVLEDGQSPATAELRGDVLVVDADLPATPDGSYEVWLIDEAVEQIISLGPVREDGRYDIPVGIDPAVLPIVDISIEPDDGDPTHSGRSVLRGTLT